MPQTKLISHLNSRWLSFRINGRNTGAYSFQNAFFYLQFADDIKMYAKDHTTNAALRAALTTQRKTRRKKKLHPQKQRYLAKINLILTLLIFKT